MNPESPNEQVVLVAHKHWASLMQSAFFVFVPGILILVFLAALRQQLAPADLAAHAVVTFLVPLSFLVVWIILAAMWTDYYLDVLVVTDRRIFYSAQQGLFSSQIDEWPASAVRTAGARISGAFESLLGYGTLHVETSEEAIEIPGLRDPETIAAVLLKQDESVGQLKETARKQQELLKFLSHEVKGHLAKSKAAFAAIVEGDYGQVSSPLGTLAKQGLADSQRGVDTVMSILDSGDAAKGDLAMQKQPFDLSLATRKLVEEFAAPAAQKGLALHTAIAPECVIEGDEEKITRHVLRNLIDNAIRYTPAGEVRVTLERLAGVARFSVADTGIGIAPADMPHLFTEGGRGEHSRDTNPDSTGYGLFVAKKIVDAHGGRIFASSGGSGAGSQFFAEFPLHTVAQMQAATDI